MTSMRRWIYTAGLCLAAALVAAPASAQVVRSTATSLQRPAPASPTSSDSNQIVQSVHIGIGGFFPRGFDSRDKADTIVADLSAAEPLDFQIGQFKSGQIFGEWSVQFGNHIEVSAGAGYYSDHVPSVYKNLVNVDGSEIRQSLGLRIIPVTGLVRFLPFGTLRTTQPYVGIGVSSLTWRYSESGQFVDTSDNSVFTDRFIASGRSVGPVVLAGIRMPVGGDIYALTLEWRYQVGLGNTGGPAAGFLDDKIDLGGAHLNFGLLVRF